MRSTISERCMHPIVRANRSRTQRAHVNGIGWAAGWREKELCRWYLRDFDPYTIV